MRHTGTRITQANLTTIPTHQPARPRDEHRGKVESAADSEEVSAENSKKRMFVQWSVGMAVMAQDFDLGGFHYSGSYPMVFQHCGAQYFDLGGGFHYSGSYPMVFQHCG